MRRLLFVGALVAVLALLMTGTALADNGPHQGDFDATSDACAGCHRIHRGAVAKLLKSGTNQQEFCFSCHGDDAAGADTNVKSGVYLNDDGVTEDPSEGTDDAGLKGGGFVLAQMDTNADGTVETNATVTSKHNVDATGTVWGNTTGTGAADYGYEGFLLKCGTCHNPHGISGGDRYRILRPIPDPDGDLNLSSGVDVTDETDKVYTVGYLGNNLRDVTYMDDTISQWCAQCHTLLHSTDAETASGNSVFSYRHETNEGKFCLVCHVAHGTSATMPGTYSGSVEWPDGTAGTSGTNSRLLHLQNRGVCYRCHPSP